MERFWSKVDIRSPSECWNWTAGTQDGGYGQFRFEQKLQLAHRVAFFLTCGHWPEPMCLHSCDNPPCCNPNHLSEGSNDDNVQQRNERDRTSRGQHYPTAKFSDEEAAAIRSQYATSNFTLRELGRLYGVDHTTISKIVLKKTYI